MHNILLQFKTIDRKTWKVSPEISMKNTWNFNKIRNLVSRGMYIHTWDSSVCCWNQYLFCLFEKQINSHWIQFNSYRFSKFYGIIEFIHICKIAVSTWLNLNLWCESEVNHCFPFLVSCFLFYLYGKQKSFYLEHVIYICIIYISITYITLQK